MAFTISCADVPSALDGIAPGSGVTRKGVRAHCMYIKYSMILDAEPIGISRVSIIVAF